MTTLQLKGRRILEIGCGIGLASPVLQRRCADITSTDLHLLADYIDRHATADVQVIIVGACCGNHGKFNQSMSSLVSIKQMSGLTCNRSGQ